MPEVRHVDLSVSEFPVCDFCSDTEPRYLESAEDFDVYRAIDAQGVPEVGTSTGSWAACETCHQLVRARKWHTLERRATDAIMRKHPDFPRSKVAEGVQTMHGLFREHRLPG